jgi:AcrR family transcriptional regulator
VTGRGTAPLSAPAATPAGQPTPVDPERVEAAVPGSAAWWHQRYTVEVRRRPRADGLSLDRIMAAALDLLDRDGLDALKMRRLADELATTHTSLYRHVASRHELLVELVDHVLGGMRPPLGGDGGDDWREQAEWSAREFRRVLLEHPALVPLLTAGQLLGPNAMRGRDRGVRSLLAAGAGGELAVHAYLLVAHYVIGTALLDTGGAARTDPERTAMTRLFRALPADAYPTVLAHAELLNAPDGEAEFEFGLRTILDGIALRLS